MLNILLFMVGQLDQVLVIIIPLAYKIPVDDFPYLLEVLASSIPVIDIICVLPHIDGQQWGDDIRPRDGSFSVIGIHDL